MCKPTVLLMVLSVLMMCVPARAAEHAGVPLYDGTVPGSHGNQGHDKPWILEYVPAKGGTLSAAVIICPGGGYKVLAMGDEGTNEAEWFQAHGVAAFVLVYRLPGDGYRFPIPLQDAQRALRWVRSQAARWNIDPNKIGIMGSSAGGHLASTLETHFDAGDPQATDPIDRVSCRPDFAVLVYPVINLKYGGVEIMLGANPDPASVRNLSNDTQVTARTPPTILFACQDDPTVPVGNSRMMYAALQKSGVPSELHVYPTGGHGWGVGDVPDRSPRGWMDTLLAWMRKQGLVG